MMHKTLFFFFLSFTQLSTVFAQSVYTVDGAIVEKGMKLRAGTGGTSQKVFVNCDNATVFTRHENGQALPVKLEFLQGAWVAQAFPPESAEPKAYLLARSDDRLAVLKPIGWVRTDELLTQDHPLLAAPGIYRKCVVVNRVDSADPENSVVRLYQRPGIANALLPSVPVRLNNVFFVYSESLDKRHVLLGTVPQIPDEPKSAIKGWAPVDRLEYWNTRFGFEWNIATLKARPERRTPGFVFGKDVTAKTYAKIASQYPGPKTESLPREILDDVLFSENIADTRERSVPFCRSDEPHFFLMNSHEDSTLSTALKPLDRYGRNSLFRVGATGSTNSDNVRYRQTLSDLRKALREVQVVLLIDKTEEMEPFLRSTKSKESLIEKTVRGLLNDYRLRLDLRGDAQRKLDLSISFYGDELYSKTPFIIAPLVAIQDFEKMDEQLAQFQTLEGDGGGDAPDSVMEAIYRATALFSRVAAKRKILMVIGTMGDRLGDKPAEFDKKVADIVARAIPSQGSAFPIELYTIQVPTPETLQGHPDAKRFVEQMEALANAVNNKWKEKTGIEDLIASVSLASNEADPVDALVAQIDERMARVESLSKEAIDKLNTANISGNASDASATVIGNFIAARLKQKGIDPNKLHFDVFEDGYLWQQSFDYDAEISQVRTMVCVEKEQVKNLLKIVSEVVQPNAFAGGSRSVIDRLSNQTIGQLTGDSFDRGASPNHISDYLAKRSLPFQTKLMQAIERGEELKDIETDLKHLKRIKLKLEDVLNHRYQEYEYVKQVRDSGETEWQFVPIDGSQREVVREVSFDGSELNTVIWLDLNEEMP